MTDVQAIEALVRKRQELKKEIAKIIVGQDTVVDRSLFLEFGLCIYSEKFHCLMIAR